MCIFVILFTDWSNSNNVILLYCITQSYRPGLVKTTSQTALHTWIHANSIVFRWDEHQTNWKWSASADGEKVPQGSGTPESQEISEDWGLRSDRYRIIFSLPLYNWLRSAENYIYSISGQTQTRPSNLQIKLFFQLADLVEIIVNYWSLIDPI